MLIIVLFVLLLLCCLSCFCIHVAVINLYLLFFVLWSICWSSSLDHFKNGPIILQRGITQVLIPLMKCQLYRLFSGCFLVLLRYSFSIFFHLHFLMMSPFNITKYLYVSFSPSFLIFSCFGSCIPSVNCLFYLSLLAWHIFYAKFSMSISWLYIHFANSFMSVLYISWLIFWALVSLHPPVHFLRDWVALSIS